MLAKRNELFQLASAEFLKWNARFLDGKRGGKLRAGARGHLGPASELQSQTTCYTAKTSNEVTIVNGE